MLASLRALRKDLFELQKTGRGLMLAFIAPALITILVGQLNIRPPSVRILIAGTPREADVEPVSKLEAILKEMSGISVTRTFAPPNDAIKEAKGGQYDLVIVCNELGTERIAAYSAGTEPARVAHLVELAATVERMVSVMDANESDRKSILQFEAHLKELRAVSARIEPKEQERLSDAGELEDHAKTPETPVQTEAVDPSNDAEQLTELAGKIEGTLNLIKASQETALQRELSAMRIIPAQSLYLYYPRARDRSAAFLPMTIALVLCFFPFIIAAPALIREKESHTIETVLTAPGMTHNGLFAAKCYLPILVAAFDAVLMFVCAESFYQFYFKNGFLLLALYVSLPTATATFLGLAISAIVRSSMQAAAASALYFVCLLLFSGFFVALDQSSGVVRMVANCLPLSTLDQIIKAWMFGGPLPDPSSLPIRLLFGQAILSGAIAWVSYRRIFVSRL